MTSLATATVETSIPSVEAAREKDRARIIDTLTLAFAADPAARWMFPDPRQYLQSFPPFAEAFGGGAVDRGTALVSEGFSGAALWLPPNTTPDEEALMRLLEASVAPREKGDAFALFEQMGHYHPRVPHWYLPLIGVEPARQGQGHGSAVLRHALRLCDDAGLPAYLEATSRRNVDLYKRHGFAAIGEIRVGRCPPIVPMLRPAQP